MTLSRALGIAVLLTLMLLTGCVSVPKAAESEDSDAKQFNAPAGKGRVYIYRISYILQHAAIPIHINGKPYGQTQGRSFLIADLAPGEYTFLSRSSNNPSNNPTARLNVEADRLYFLLQDVKVGGAMGYLITNLQWVGASMGRAHIMQTSLLVPTPPEP